MAAEKAAVSLQSKNDSLARQLELAKQNIQQLKVAPATLLLFAVCNVPALIWLIKKYITYTVFHKKRPFFVYS